VRLLRQAFVSSSAASVRFSLSTPNTSTFVAETDGIVVGTAMAMAFGVTAWLGSIVVAPDRQHQGVGTALTEAALQLAQEKAKTVLLLALEPARRIYERLGFVDDGLYGTWILTQASPHPGARSVDASRTRRTVAMQALDQCSALDRLATGEDRRPYLEPLASQMRLVLAGEGRGGAAQAALGYAGRLSWGAGPIIAKDPEVGARLVRDEVTANPKVRIEFPDANETGQALVHELGMRRVDDDVRMRLGPPLAGFRPDYVYKVLTPAVG
jgi:Acetyltransferase (GNAT) domain